MVYRRDFKYSGRVERFISPFSGMYQLEAWGGQGGTVYSTYWKDSYSGGFGAYSTGNIFLNHGDILYIVVGESGKANSESYSYNGGGYGEVWATCNTQTSSGGGCTHFAYKKGELKSLKDSKESVLLVASGGGGAYTRTCNENSDSGSFTGGNGGGIIGSSPIYIQRGGYSNTVPTGGNQSRGGISVAGWNTEAMDSTTELYNGFFGQGGIYMKSGCFSGAESGWYGGASGTGRAGAGGSSYVSPLLHNYDKFRRHITCYNCVESNNENEYTISVSINNTDAISDTAKSGNGYARITLLSIAQTCNLTSRNKRNMQLFMVFLIFS